MRVALIAHDKKKPEFISFVKNHLSSFMKHELFATGTTGSLLIKETGLNVTLKKSGPLGGDQEIGSMVANGLIDMIFFF